MGRWRPPPPVSSKYITPEGKQRLEEELEFLWRKKRPEVTKALSAAAAEGDRSENAEYIYRKKQLREIDSRVRFLRKRLENMKVVYKQSPEEMAAELPNLLDQGPGLVGGCCGSSPAHIRLFRQIIDQRSGGPRQ